MARENAVGDEFGRRDAVDAAENPHETAETVRRVDGAVHHLVASHDESAVVEDAAGRPVAEGVGLPPRSGTSRGRSSPRSSA